MFWPPIDTNNLSQSELHESRGGTGIRWNFYDERLPFSCYRLIPKIDKYKIDTFVNFLKTLNIEDLEKNNLVLNIFRCLRGAIG